jgi:hypothetical protein
VVAGGGFSHHRHPSGRAPPQLQGVPSGRVNEHVQLALGDRREHVDLSRSRRRRVRVAVRRLCGHTLSMQHVGDCPRLRCLCHGMSSGSLGHPGLLHWERPLREQRESVRARRLRREPLPEREPERSLHLQRSVDCIHDLVQRRVLRGSPRASRPLPMRKRRRSPGSRTAAAA